MDNHAVVQAGLEKLPVELSLDIIKQLDFTSLWNVFLSSRRVRQVFDSHALEIVQAILARSVPPATHSTIRDVIRLHTGAAWEQDNLQGWQALRLRWSSVSLGWTEVTFHEREKKLSSVLDLPTTDVMERAILPADFGSMEQAAALRKFVQLARQIHLLAHVCMDKWMQTLKAAVPTDESSRLYEAHFHAPSWLESQRVMLALWRLQLFLEIKNSAVKQRISSWSAVEQEKVEDSCPQCFYYYSLRWPAQFRSAQMQSVIETLSDLFPHIHQQHDNVEEETEALTGDQNCKRRHSTLPWTASSTDQTWRLPSATDVSQTILLTRCICSSDHHRLNGDKYEYQSTGGKAEPDDEVGVCRSFRFYVQRERNTNQGCLQYITFQPFLKYGFAFWSGNREFGVDHGYDAGSANVFDRNVQSWYRLLTEEEIEVGKQRRDENLARVTVASAIH